MQSESFTITDHWTSAGIGITQLNARTIWDGEDQSARLHISRHIAAYPSSDFRRGLSDGTNFTAIMARNPQVMYPPRNPDFRVYSACIKS